MSKFSFIFAVTVLTVSALFLFSNKEAYTMTTEKNKKTTSVVLIKTSAGDIKLELYPEKAPITVENFLQYVNEGHYDNTIFHRVIDGFMIQGGGFTADLKQKSTRPAIKNEASNGIGNKRGTIAMARTQDVDSATAQFFINVADNAFLDFRSESPHEYGYCVFGHVTEGMDVVDKIKATETQTRGSYSDLPVKPIEILKTEEVEI